MAQVLIVVERFDLTLFDTLREKYAGVENLTVIRDRRRTRRRRHPQMRFVVEPGAFMFGVGASAADIRAEQIVELSGAVAEYRQHEVVATETAIE